MYDVFGIKLTIITAVKAIGLQKMFPPLIRLNVSSANDSGKSPLLQSLLLSHPGLCFLGSCSQGNHSFFFFFFCLGLSSAPDDCDMLHWALAHKGGPKGEVGANRAERSLHVTSGEMLHLTSPDCLKVTKESKETLISLS